MRKGKNRYIVEVNEWGCGLMIKDTQTGREIDAPDDEVITLCIKEMNSLAKELDTVRSVAEDNQAELKATRIENARLKAECQARQAENSVLAVECESLKAEVERLTFRPEHYLDDDGEWVSNIVFYRMQERLKAEVERLTAFTTRTIIPNEELQAQVERLTKAGDAMAHVRAHEVAFDEAVTYDVAYRLDYLTAAWHAAKEGKDKP